MEIKGNIATFESELVMEGSFGSYGIGKHFNQMEFTQLDASSGCIIWNYGIEAADEDETGIGLSFDGKELIDYDGTMSLPVQAIELLESLGYDCSYAKD